MGNKISRIEKEFIINSLNDKKMPLNVYGNKENIPGILLNCDDSMLEITSRDTSWDQFSPDDNVKIFFAYFGNVMTFITRIIKIDDNLFIKYPDEIYKNLQRKYIRVVPPAEIQAAFYIENTKIELNFPKSEEYAKVEFQDDLNERYASIESLILQFREKVHNMVSGNKIVMFRNREPESIEEKIIVKTTKILYIPSVDEPFPEFDPDMEERIVTRSHFIPSNEEPDGIYFEDLKRDELSKYLKEKKDSGVYAEVYCPILYHEYVIGYIYLTNPTADSGRIDKMVIAYLIEFSKILAYALEKSGYFKKNIKGPKEYRPNIVDISASGLLFTHSSEKFKEIIILYKDTDIHLSFGERKMKIGARIMRKYSEGQNSYYGAQFLEVKPEDLRFLFDFVYGRNITDTDIDTWEGGASPPELVL